MAIEQQTKPIGRINGLAAHEVEARRERGEINITSQETSRSYRRIIFDNAFTFINVVLYVIVGALVALGLYGDAGMTALLVVANVFVGIIQESRAKRKLDKVALLTRPSALVIRDGQEHSISPDEIVRGDALVLRQGDQILVDGEVLESHGLTVDESLLTGESDLVPKRKGSTVHSGSFCMGGSGVFRADKVGEGSVAQQITSQARQFRKVQTPLEREVGLVLKVMGVLVIALSVNAAVMYQQLYHGLPLRESVQAAAVLVSLVPQGLVFMVTLTYTMAAVRLSGKGALIQRMNAVESTSHIDILCIDKTGTLTTNQLALHEVEPLGVDEATLRQMLGDYAASTKSGNRTTDAIAAACAGQARSVVEEAPFSSARKWSALTVDDGQRPGTYVLGAPEMLAPGLKRGADTGQETRAAWADHGLRVLQFAYHPGSPSLLGRDGEPRLPSNLVPLGNIAISDELRPDAQETIAGFTEAGIGLKIISGDNPETVAALARQAGFAKDLKAISGQNLEGLNEEELRTVVNDATVFGRITPQQKERLVGALRAEGHYVAMIGDGVNDVLALKRADLAISMRSGSQVTRSIADIVLFQDSFAVLPAAFREGQRILRGMRDIIRLFLVRTLYVAFIILGTSLLGYAFPITPKHNAILALLTVGIPVFAMAAWARPEKTNRKLVLTSGSFILPAALSITVVGLMLYAFYTKGTGDVTTARSALTTATILCGLILIPFSQPPNEAFVGGTDLNGDWKPAMLAGLMVGLYVAILALPLPRDFYELRVLSLPEYFIIVFVVIGWAAVLRFAWRFNALGRVRALRVRGIARPRRLRRDKQVEAPAIHD